MAISNTEITTVGTDIFVCPGTIITDVQEHAITCVIFCNISEFDTSLTVYAISAANNNIVNSTIINNLIIPAGETFTFDTEKLVFSTGDRLHAVSSVASTLVTTASTMRVN